MEKKLMAILITLATPVFLYAEIKDSLDLTEIVVTGTRNAVDVRHIPMTVTVIERETLTKQYRPSVLPTVMQQVPGFFLTSRSMMGYGVGSTAAGSISLRGLSGKSGQMMVLIDGHPQYQGIYGHPIADSYQTLNAERVEVLRGPASMLYGSNAMGGVMNIVTHAPQQQDTIETHFTLGAGSHATIQAEGTNQLRVGKFTSTVSAQYNRSDNHRPRMGFEQYGGAVKLGYDINERWKAYANSDITHFNSSNPGKTDSPLYDADQSITRGNASVGIENHYNRTSGAISAYSNFGWHKIDDGTNDPTAPTKRYFRSRDALTGISAYQSAQLFTGNRLTLGVDYQHIYGRAYYTSKETGEVLDTPNKQSGESHRNEIAGYVDFRQDLLEWLTIDAGVRLDHHSICGTEWIPQAGIVVRPIEKGEIKAIASKGFRNPTMSELYLYPVSNEELNPERIWNYELSWRHRIGTVIYGANLYYIKGDNMIAQAIVNGRPRNVNTGEIENYGGEVDATWHINSHWNVSTNHSLLHMKNPVISAPTYKGFLGVDGHYARWSVSTNLQYIHDLFTSVGTAETKESFLLLNMSASYSINKNISLWARGENLLAQRYETYQGYPMPLATVMAGVHVSF